MARHAKCRRSLSFKMIYRWIEPVDILVIRADRQEPLVVIRLDNYLKLSGTSGKS